MSKRELEYWVHYTWVNASLFAVSNGTNVPDYPSLKDFEVSR